MTERPPPSNWNIANALTMLRIAVVPVYGWYLVQDGGMDPRNRWIATGIFIAAMITDRIDGDIARSRGLVTDFGKVSDPIADKTLTGMALLGLSWINVVPWWMSIAIIARELGITALRFVVLRFGVMPASRGGKVKTFLQAVALGMLSAPLDGGWLLVGMVVLWVALIVTVATGVDYLFQARTLVRRSRASGRPAAPMSSGSSSRP